MFNQEEIIEFFNRIINAQDIKEDELKNNVTKFYEYLELTKMCDTETLSRLSIVIQCLDEIIKLRKAAGYFDIETLLKGKEIAKEKQRQKIKKTKEVRHYDHYESDYTSSSCGSSSYTSRC